MKKFEQQIIDFLSRPNYKPIKASSLTKQMNLAKALLPKHKSALESLVNEGKVYVNSKGRLYPSSANGTLIGTIRKTSGGMGFLMPLGVIQVIKGVTDIFVPPEDLHGAMDGDEVRVKLTKRRRREGQRCGFVETILSRSTNSFVGKYIEKSGQGFVEVDKALFDRPIPVGDPGAKGASENDKVVIEMLRFPKRMDPGDAVLIKILGQHGAPGVDVQSIIYEFQLPTEFPEEALEEASRQAELFDETDLTDREDLTKTTIITIDPADARDFDDAISLSKTVNGNWLLGVHIADVAHFVEEGSPLDIEARNRATSIYLPGRVIPMLPEVISNGLASLQANKVRFAKTVFIEYTPEGIPISTEYHNSAIKVNRRFHYEQILEYLENPENDQQHIPAKIRQLIDSMHELAMILRKKRFEKGALELNLPEVELEMNKKGEVTGASESSHDVSHQMIEEFMLAANVAIAKSLHDKGIGFLRRAHADPDAAKLKAFGEFSETLGYPLKKFQSKKALQDLINKVKGTAHEQAINYALLRSMKQAEYSCDEIGHYALSESEYAHFTSPIRRYPDLTVHRTIGALVKFGSKAKKPDISFLKKMGLQCSMQERRAANAERELTKVKLLAYMEKHQDEEWDAVVTGVESFGFFCKAKRIPVEGLVHLSDLDDGDFYDYDQKARALIGRKTGREYRLGFPIRVKVDSIDIERRLLKWIPVLDENDPNSQKKLKKKRSSEKSSGKHFKSNSKKSRSSNNSSASKSSSKRKKPSNGKRGTKGKKKRKKS